MAKAVDERTLLVECRGEKFKITIPADWKVTFGKAMQGRGYESDPDGRELRIYECETKQRACFTGVRSFRDLSIPVVRLVVSESGENFWEDDGDGTHTSTRKVRRSVKEVSEPF